MIVRLGSWGGRAPVALSLMVAALGCGRSDSPHAGSAVLPRGVLAQVDQRPITVAMVTAERQGPLSGSGSSVDFEEVTRRLIRREVLAAGITEVQPDLGRVAERAGLARSLLTELRKEAATQGPVSDDEVEAIVEKRWLELARPRAVRTVHAVALPTSPEHWEAARVFAERVAEAVRGIIAPDAFADAARAVQGGAPPGVELRVEALPPVAGDGRTVPVDILDQGGPPALVTEYAEAACRLQQVGEQSPAIQTNYGWHVVLAVEIVPELRPGASEVRAVVEAEALSLRARPRREQLVASLRATTSIDVARNASELTRAIWDHR